MSSTGFFGNLAPVRFEGPDSDNPLAYRHYDKDALILGKRMEDHLRPAVCYWHSFGFSGADPFGGQTIERPWFGDDLAHARVKADAAFEMLHLLGVPFFTFHDRDIAPEGTSLREYGKNVREMAATSRRRWPTPASGSSGEHPTSSTTGVSWPERRPIRTRTCSPIRPPR